MSALFPGEARPLPAGGGGRGMLVRFTEGGGPDVGALVPVRHAMGYEPFVAFVVRSGVDPAVLARDLGAFGAFVRESREELADPALVEAAAVFLGNLLAVVHPRASWRVTSEPEVGTDAVSMPVRGAVASMRDHPEFTARMTAELPARWREADERHDAVQATMAMTSAATDAAHLSDVPDLVVPVVAVGPFLDEDGDPIPYGDRWPESPPDEAYSRVSHPERFAPLHTAAEALIAHLDRHYDVVTTRSTDEDRSVTLRPSSGAPIRIALTDFPGVRVDAGLLLRTAYPSCGCDACDEVAATEVDDMVGTVLGVVAGGFAERLAGPAGPGSTSLRTADGGGQGSGGVDLPDEAERLVSADALAALDGAAWPAWPRRD